MPISAANDLGDHLTHEQRFLAKSITPTTSEQVARQQAHDAAQKLSQARAEQDIRSTMDAFTHFAWVHRAAELDLGLLGMSMMMGPGQQTQQKPVSHTGSASMFGGAQMMFPIAGGNGAIPVDTTPSDVSNIAAYELPRTIAKLAEVGDSLNSVAYLGEAITNQDPVTKAHVSTESALIGAGLSLAGLFGGEGVVARLIGGRAEALPKLSTTEAEFYKKAQLIGRYDYLNPGRLPNDMGATFIGSRYESYKLLDDVILQRGGTKLKAFGQSFSFDKPVGELQMRIDKAVMPVWPTGGASPIDTGFSIRIPEGSIVHLGDVANQGEIFMGGTRQVVVQAPWTIPGVEVVDTYPLQEEVLWNEIANQLKR